ncbi:hypothetical protein QNA19_23900, partial [Rhodococcus fascians]|uniref:hypothetical protein n=2 Tax=Nocardiaceae TaxID=85025 RepID=UPI0024BB55A8
ITPPHKYTARTPEVGRGPPPAHADPLASPAVQSGVKNSSIPIMNHATIAAVGAKGLPHRIHMRPLGAQHLTELS